MNKKYYFFFVALIVVLFAYSYYFYNEFVIAQSVLVLIFLFSQFFQYKMFKENTELISKHFKQETFNKERFTVISQIDKDLLSICDFLTMMFAEVNSDDYSEEEYKSNSETMNDISNELDRYCRSNHLFFYKNEWDIIKNIIDVLNDFNRNEYSDKLRIDYKMDILMNDLNLEFKKSLAL